MDKSLFESQEEFTRLFIRDKYQKEIEDLTEEEKLDLVKDYALHMHSEISSMISNTSYKMHRRPREKLIGSNVNEEIVDTIKFGLGLWAILGGTSDTFKQAFIDKTQVVSWRCQQEKDLDRLAESEVAVLDIDGVLAEYPGPMLNFMMDRSGISFSNKKEAKDRLGLLQYEELKTQYRISGVKAKLPLVDGCLDLINYLVSKKIPIVLISSRPYEKHLQILQDTLHWVEKFKIPAQALYFDREKGLKMVKRFPKAKIFVDDNPAFVEDICSSCKDLKTDNIKVFLFDPSGKKEIPNGAIRADSFKKIIDILERSK